MTIPATTVQSYLKQNYPMRVLGWVKKASWVLNKSVPLKAIDMAKRPGGRDQKKVDGIAEAVKAGKKMEPVVLVKTSDGYEIADGYHRTLAFSRAGKSSIPAYVGTGAGEHGPWERSMHAAKLNTETVHVGRAVVKKET